MPQHKPITPEERAEVRAYVIANPKISLMRIASHFHTNVSRIRAMASDIRHVEKETRTIFPYTGDPFRIVDGRFIGDDGFEVPRDLDEWIERKPNYVRNWVWRRLVRNGSNPAIDPDILEDWAADLYLHLRYLPEDSIGRKQGHTDSIQCFNPYKMWGASLKRFNFYVNTCLENKFQTINVRVQKDATQRPGNISYNPVGSYDPKMHGEGDGTEEFIHASSRLLSEKLSQQKSAAFWIDFCNFVEKHEPTLLHMLKTFIEHAGFEEGVKMNVGLSPSEFYRGLKRLKLLAQCFKNGLDIPKWKRYKRKAPKSAECIAREVATLAGDMYFVGAPCQRGHTKRFTASGACVECSHSWRKKAK